MKICGIIAEYNPFHNGHRYQLERTRELYGATHIAAVMSGNFTQRGDAAILDKYRRAEAALRGGVDLVIELPVAYALASAEQFALGAVGLLNALGCVELLSFGSESGDISALREAAAAVLYAAQTDDFYTFMKGGDPYPAALQKAVEKYYTDDVVALLTTPNNTLAIEYLKAMDELGCAFSPVTVKRIGAAHDGENAENGYASASAIRKMIRAGEDISAYAPPLAVSDIAAETADLARLETAILAKLRTMSRNELLKVPNVLAGLENRLYKAIRASGSLAEVAVFTKTKRYTMARIRRILLSAFLGIKKSDPSAPPPYIHILGMNERGKEILAAAKCSLPIDTSLKALMGTGDKARRFALLEADAGDLYALAFQKPRPCGLDFTSKPIIL
ncbi:MAG: nucleotidyltransferase family protein [Bacteroides sp.]|nr:nucleotidyltransferase family protein [Eubacterium sp.]MCM1419440.1 nucleotidyltransferase family protein [Roseburia sp.]MCM1463292.1 nucleotidyltransferase family protein [Bacteroides sp.]